MNNRAYFEYKGRKSTDFYMYIENELTIPIPEEDIELVEIIGKDGDVAMSKGRLKGVNKSFPCILDVPQGKNIAELAKDISEWLRTEVGWDKLTFTGYEGYEFEAICYETFDIEETLRTRGRTVINFRLKPYKFKTNGVSAVILTNGQTLNNTEKRNAKPLIKIYGTGSITLKNKGKDWLILTSVDDYITIDSAQMSVHKDGLQQFQKMNANLKPLFPVLASGNNVITWTGTVSKVEITPRWEAVI